MPETFDKSIEQQIIYWNKEYDRVTKALAEADVRSVDFDNMMREKQSIRIKIITLKSRIAKSAEERRELFGEVVSIPKEFRL